MTNLKEVIKLGYYLLRMKLDGRLWVIQDTSASH